MSKEVESAVDALLHIVHSRPSSPPPEEVQAYAKLQGEDFTHYIRTLSVVIGRKSSPNDDVDVDLGNSKIISRKHARIEYNFFSKYFEIYSLGKNGIFVDGKFINKESTAVPLETKTLIQIGEKWFYFLLPINSIQKTKPLIEESKENSQTILSGNISSVRQYKSNFPITESPAATVPNSPFNSRPPSPGFDAPEGELPDYRTNAEIKPPYSYASLIAQAINNTPDKKLTLSGIYQFITDFYPFYKSAQNGWQNSIRHNLSLNKAFVKKARNENEPGKGAFWSIDQQYEELFSEGVYRRKYKPKSSRSTNASPLQDEKIEKRKPEENSEEKKRQRVSPTNKNESLLANSSPSTISSSSSTSSSYVLGGVHPIIANLPLPSSPPLNPIQTQNIKLISLTEKQEYETQEPPYSQSQSQSQSLPQSQPQSLHSQSQGVDPIGLKEALTNLTKAQEKQ